MAKEAAPAGVAPSNTVSSPSDPSRYQEPTSGFLMTGRGEFDKSEPWDLIVGTRIGAGRQIVAGRRA